MIKLTYNSPTSTSETLKITLTIDNNYGFVEKVVVLFNGHGQKPGADTECKLEYSKEDSTNDYSVFKGGIIFATPGYRTFLIRLEINGVVRYIKFNDDGEIIITETEEGEGNYWEVNIYLSTFKTSNSIKGGIMYQIYVDTFYNQKTSTKTTRQTTPWNDEIKWRPDEDGYYRNNQFYGGNLQGIIAKLPYIKELGTTVIYLTPVFKSPSSNRYDITNYEEIDELIGNWKDLAELHEKANQLGIELVLDVVFNHSSSQNHLYQQFPDMYAWEEKYTKPKCWWGFAGLTEFNQNNEKYKELLKKWLHIYSNYADGIRLDVADSLSDETLILIRENWDKYILGEVWKHAVTGDYRGFLEGNKIDGVMNYQFANCIYRYLRYGNCKYFKNLIENIYQLYPHQALDVSPIFLSSHDIPRIQNILVGEFMKEGIEYENIWSMEQDSYWYTNGEFDTLKFRTWEAEHEIPEEKKELAERLQKLAAFMQYTLPGIPSIFAGDEVGICGYKDPFNRVPFPWEKINCDMLKYYRKLGGFRNEYNHFLNNGDNFKINHIDEKLLVYERGRLKCFINRSDKPVMVEELGFGKKVFSSTEGARKNEANIILPYEAIATIL